MIIVCLLLWIVAFVLLANGTANHSCGLQIAAVVLFIVGYLSVLVGNYIDDRATDPGRRLVSIDIEAECVDNYGWGYQANYGNNSDADSWRCVSPLGKSRTIDLHKACTRMYGARATAILAEDNAYGWRCKY